MPTTPAVLEILKNRVAIVLGVIALAVLCAPAAALATPAPAVLSFRMMDVGSPNKSVGIVPFGDAIYHLIQLLELTFEELMLVVKIRAFDIPMSVTGFGAKYKFIRENFRKFNDNRLAVLFSYSNVGFHFPGFRFIDRIILHQRITSLSRDPAPLQLRLLYFHSS